MAVVLVVEDDPVARVLHTRALAELDGVSVVTASTLSETRLILPHLEPDLVVLDLRLPDGTGVDILQLLADEGRSPQILVVSAFLEDLDAHDTTSCHIVQLSKPAAPADLRRAVEVQLANQLPAIPFSLPEYIQLACLGGHSLCLKVTAPSGAGQVQVFRGEIWSARWEALTGFPALAAAVAASEHRVRLNALSQDPGVREMAGGWQGLLIESVRLHDEAARSLRTPVLADEELDFSDLFASVEGSLSSAPDSGSRQVESSRSDALPPSGGSSRLVERGVRAVISRDYATAVMLFERALELDPNAAAVRHRLERLRSLVSA